MRVDGVLGAAVGLGLAVGLSLLCEWTVCCGAGVGLGGEGCRCNASGSTKMHGRELRPAAAQLGVGGRASA